MTSLSVYSFFSYRKGLEVAGKRERPTASWPSCKGFKVCRALIRAAPLPQPPNLCPPPGFPTLFPGFLLCSEKQRDLIWIWVTWPGTRRAYSTLPSTPVSTSRSLTAAAEKEVPWVCDKAQRPWRPHRRGTPGSLIWTDHQSENECNPFPRHVSIFAQGIRVYFSAVPPVISQVNELVPVRVREISMKWPPSRGKSLWSLMFFLKKL